MNHIQPQELAGVKVGDVDIRQVTTRFENVCHKALGV
jgi:diphthamide synthase (EF-2-diphthine--ammonia ligase)